MAELSSCKRRTWSCRRSAARNALRRSRSSCGVRAMPRSPRSNAKNVCEFLDSALRSRAPSQPVCGQARVDPCVRIELRSMEHTFVTQTATKAEGVERNPPQPKGWRLYERKGTPTPFRIQARDLEIVRQVFRHRFLRPAHIQLLLGGSAANLARRCRLLWEHNFLERPLA